MPVPSDPFFRTARPEDACSLAAISIEVWISTYQRNGVSSPFADFALTTFTPAYYTDLITRDETALIVSENTQGIDGFILLDFAATRALPECSETEISTFYIQPRHHGKGLGRSLLSKALKLCQERGVSSVWLTSNQENAPAIGFYVKQGFQIIGQTDFTLDGQNYANDVFQLDL